MKLLILKLQKLSREIQGRLLPISCRPFEEISHDVFGSNIGAIVAKVETKSEQENWDIVMEPLRILETLILVQNAVNNFA